MTCICGRNCERKPVEKDFCKDFILAAYMSVHQGVSAVECFFLFVFFYHMCCAKWKND